MDDQSNKQIESRESKDLPIVTLSDVVSSGIVHLDRVERGKVYYNAKFKIFDDFHMYQFPVWIEDRDERFVFLSIEKTNRFKFQIRKAIDLNLLKKIW